MFRRGLPFLIADNRDFSSISASNRSLLLSLGLGSNSNLYHHKLLVLPQVKYCEKRFDQLSIEQRCLS